jgi:hypothetical protein
MTGIAMKRLLTPSLTKRLCKLLADGVPVKTASESIGVTDRTIRSWLASASENDADPALVAFASAVSCAKAKGRIVLLRRIIEAAKRDWRAAAFVLARLSPEEFGVAATETSNFASRPTVHFSTRYVAVHDDGVHE